MSAADMADDGAAATFLVEAARTWRDGSSTCIFEVDVSTNHDLGLRLLHRRHDQCGADRQGHQRPCAVGKRLQ